MSNNTALTISEMEEYLLVFNKKFEGFISRAPIYLTFEATPLAVFLQFGDYTEVKEFPIDYSIPVEDLINEIKIYLHNYHYPTLVNTIKEKIEPNVSDINNLMNKKDIPFEEAFTLLASKIRKETHIIDKVDIKQNKIVLLDGNGKNVIYQSDIPVMIFLRKIENMNEKNRWNEFELHCKKVHK